MAKIENPSPTEGEEQHLEDGDHARERSLQLGGGLPFGRVFGTYFTFLVDVREELKKVTWPTRKMVVTETAVVLAVVVFFTALITGIDQVLAFGMNALLFGR